MVRAPPVGEARNRVFAADDVSTHGNIHSDPLRWNRNFILLWCAYGISAFGDHLSEMGILKLKHALDPEVDATPIFARMTFLFFLPFLIVGPIGGLLADRFSRRGLMIAADLARCFVLIGFGGMLSAVRGWGDLGQLSPILLIGVFAALFSPSRLALLPTIVNPGQLSRANGLISGMGIIAGMIAYKVGGHLADRVENINAVFLANAVTFAASAGCLWFLRPDTRAAHTTTNRLPTPTGFADGLRYITAHRHVWELLIIAALVWFCGSTVNSVVPAMVKHFGGTLSDIGTNRALIGFGFIIGAGLITLLGKSLRHEVGITWGLFGLAATVGGLAMHVAIPSAMSSLWLGGVLLTLSGVFGVVVIANYTALLQRTVADRIRGRVFGIADLATTSALLMATGLLGLPHWPHLDRGVGLILVLISGLLLAAGLYTFITRMRRSRFPIVLTFWRHLVEMFARFWWGLERVGPCTVPGFGCVIIAANHRSTPDPLLIISSVPHRMVSFLVAAEYTKWPVFGYFTREGQTIPVTRSGQDTAALKQSMRHLKDGKVLGIFIEGGIIPPNERPEPRDGVSMLALRTGATVIPAHISGVTYRDSVVKSLLTRHKARVRYGKPVDLSDLLADPGNRENVHEATRRIYAAIHALAPADDVYEGDEPKRYRRRRQQQQMAETRTAARAESEAAS